MSNLKSDIKKILESAAQAPSGENCQPWHFIVKNNLIEIHNRPERDTSIYNWKQRGSYAAIGAAIENIIIVSESLGYRVEISKSPDQKDPEYIALIKLAEGGNKSDITLVDSISKRVTNRKPYNKSPIARQLSELIVKVSSGLLGISISFTDNSDEIKKLAQAASANEEIMFNNKDLHSFFFSHINWNEKEDKTKRSGFYIKTLELEPSAKIAFNFIKHWGIMSFLNKLSFNRKIAGENAKLYATAQLYIAIKAEDLSQQSYIAAGRTMQRIWLNATKQGISLQPLTGVLFFMRHVESGDTVHFSPQEKTTIQNAYNSIASVFGVNSGGNQKIILMMRLGYADKPSTQARKFQLDEVVTWK